MVTPISTSYTLSDTKLGFCPQCPTVAPSVILNCDFTLSALLSHPQRYYTGILPSVPYCHNLSDGKLEFCPQSHSVTPSVILNWDFALGAILS